MLEENPVYEPDEDSFLIAETLIDSLNSLKKSGVKLSDLSLLDMGSGSGYLGGIALKRKFQTTFVDVNPLAVDYINKKYSKKKKATIIESDLFSNIPKQKFDIITFNTPYLPEDEELFDLALHGGPKGYEVTLSFIDGVKDYLSEEGFLILLISSLTHPDVVEAKLFKLGFDFEIVNRKKLFFEELLVYKVRFR